MRTGLSPVGRGRAGNTGSHTSTPSAPTARRIPDGEHFRVPREVDTGPGNLLLAEEIRSRHP